MDGLNNMNNTSNMSNTLLNLSKTQIKKQKTIKICGYFRENQYLCIINSKYSSLNRHNGTGHQSAKGGFSRTKENK